MKDVAVVVGFAAHIGAVGEEVAAIVLFCLKAVDHVFLPAVGEEELRGRSLDFLSHVLIAVGLADAGDDDLVVPRPVDALHDYGKAGGNKRGRGLRLQRREQCRPAALRKTGNHHVVVPPLEVLGDGHGAHDVRGGVMMSHC